MVRQPSETSFEQDQRCSRRWSPLTEIMEEADGTATVALAAAAYGVAPGQIASGNCTRWPVVI